MDRRVLIVDARGHRCPVPTLRLRRALETVAVGEMVELIADDPMARIDAPHFAAGAGHAVVEVSAEGAGVRIRVRRGPPAGPAAPGRG